MYAIKLEKFEGPFDLLLHVIKKNEIEIYDIPIAQITKEYLEYIELMQELNIEVAGEFLVMASTLIRMKAKMLLPKPDPPYDELEEGELTRDELIKKLIEYKKFKEVALKLDERSYDNLDKFTRPSDTIPEYLGGEIKYIETSLFDLLSSYKKILTKINRELPTEIHGEEFTVEQKILHILNKVRTQHSVKFSDLFSEVRSKLEVVTTLLALLELIKIRRVIARQSEFYSEIYIVKNVLMDENKQNDEEPNET